MKASHYQDIGHYLRDSRESLRISIDKAAADIHIRPCYLQAIEAGTLSQLPGRTYARGYLRTYASYLRLPLQEVLDAFDALQDKQPAKFFVPEPTHRQNLPAGRILWVALAGLLALYGYWYFAIHDRSGGTADTAETPQKSAELLDKNARLTLDTARNAWGECFSAGRIECLAMRPAPPADIQALYEFVFTDTPAQKP